MQTQNNIDNTYNIIRIRGQGGCSIIYLVTNVNNHNQYVAKVRIKEKQRSFNR